MAVHSVIKTSALASGFRLDAEYYQPRYLADAKQLSNVPCVQLKNMAFITDGIHSGPEVADESGIPYIGAKAVHENGLAMGDVLRITERQHTANLRTSLRGDDVLITTTGTIGWTAVVQSEDLPANIDRDLGLIRVNADAAVDPYFVATFLNCEYGRFQTAREATGNVQQHLFIEKLRELSVPVLGCAKSVAMNTRRAYAKRREATAAMTAAETLILSALGLDDLDLSPSRSYARPFRDLLAEGRFDAEFFHPRSQAILKQLRRSGVTIGDVAQLAERIFRPEQQKNGGTFQYIEIGSLTGVGEAESETIAVAEAPSRAQFIVRPGDIITSTVRPIRRLSALIRPDQDGCVCSSGFAVLSPPSSEGGIESEVLLAYLRLPIVCEILDLYCTASMYPAIPVDRLLKVPVMMPEKRVRTKIVEHVRAALFASQEAARLLEQAKQTVEEMIPSKA